MRTGRAALRPQTSTAARVVLRVFPIVHRRADDRPFPGRVALLNGPHCDGPL
jgi:hypothetical protein